MRWCGPRQGAARPRLARAGEAGLTAVADVAEVAGRADVVLSVCPPHAAVQVAREVSAAGFRGLYVDANAVSPDHRAGGRRHRRGRRRGVRGRRDHRDAAGRAGVHPALPVRRPRRGGAPIVRRTEVDARVIDGGAFAAASAVKMAYASWTKGSAALLLEARALARAEGVEETLLAEWGISQPGLEARSAARPGPRRPRAGAGSPRWRRSRRRWPARASPTAFTWPLPRSTAAPSTPPELRLP